VAEPAKRRSLLQPPQLPPPPPLIPADFAPTPDQPAQELLNSHHLHSEPSLQDLHAYAFQGRPLPQASPNAPPLSHRPERPMPSICPLSAMDPEERADYESRERGWKPGDSHFSPYRTISDHSPQGQKREPSRHWSWNSAASSSQNSCTCSADLVRFSLGTLVVM
jgi:hypothetical protein